MTESVSGVTASSSAPVEVKQPEEKTATVTTAPVKENPTEVGAGVTQATPTESQAKKLYITA